MCPMQEKSMDKSEFASISRFGKKGGIMEESFPMNGGDDTHSYSTNSSYQKSVHDFAMERLKDALFENVDTISNPFRIANFGCSVGPNTLFAMQDIIEAVQHNYSSSHDLEFQVFFNDHVANDFNTLIASLPSNKKYHAAITPGSFHSRLFPRASINVAYSSFALHWLSRVPGSVSDSKSSAWNEGRIHYWGSSKAVENAYTRQFEKDKGNFMNSRAEEVVSGGIMVLTFIGIPHERSDNNLSAIHFDVLGSILLEMANEGVVKKTQIDTFNVPIYAPTTKIVRKVVEKNGFFCIEKMETTNHKIETKESNVQNFIENLRAVTGGMFTKHFGSEVVEKIFNKASKKEYSDKLLSAYSNATYLLAILKHK